MASLRAHLHNLFQLNKRYFVSRYRRKRAARENDDGFYERLPQIVFEEAPCIFVLSTGRCGTMLLTRMLQRADNIEAYHAPEPELVYPSRLAYANGKDQFEAYCTAAKCARYDLIEESVITGRVYAETNCKITFFAPHLHQVFSESKFIHLVRHPVSFVRSAIARGYYQRARADRGHIFPVSEPEKSQWESMSLVEKVTWNWNETNRYIEAFKHELPEEKYTTIQSEELFNEADSILRLLQFCDARGITRSEISSLQNRPMNASSSGRDEKLSERRNEVRARAILANKYGYTI